MLATNERTSFGRCDARKRDFEAHHRRRAACAHPSGPGLLESTYEACLVYELSRRGLSLACQVPLPVIYDAVRIPIGYRVDMIIADRVIVELKAVDAIHPIHRAQLLSYLRLTGKKLGLLFNFNEVHLKDGIIRLVNNL